MHSEPQLQLPPEFRFEAEWRFELGRMLRAQLAQLQQNVGTAASIALRGKAAKAVAEVAAELRADLLVIGRSPVSRIFGGVRTTAYGIVRESPCPVLSV
jgi:nucleotide-binding universal stress UspA family protein